MFLQRIFVLGIHVATADFNGIQFIAPNATVQNLLAARFGVEVPPSVSLDDGYWQRPVRISDDKRRAGRILGVHNNRIFLLSFRSKGRSVLLISDLVLGSDQVFAAWAENLRQSRHIKTPSGLNECVDSLLRGSECFMALCRSLGRLLL